MPPKRIPGKKNGNNNDNNKKPKAGPMFSFGAGAAAGAPVAGAAAAAGAGMNDALYPGFPGRELPTLAHPRELQYIPGVGEPGHMVALLERSAYYTKMGEEAAEYERKVKAGDIPMPGLFFEGKAAQHAQRAAAFAAAAAAAAAAPEGMDLEGGNYGNQVTALHAAVAAEAAAGAGAAAAAGAAGGAIPPGAAGGAPPPGGFAFGAGAGAPPPAAAPAAAPANNRGARFRQMIAERRRRYAALLARGIDLHDEDRYPALALQLENLNAAWMRGTIPSAAQYIGKSDQIVQGYKPPARGGTRRRVRRNVQKGRRTRAANR